MKANVSRSMRRILNDRDGREALIHGVTRASKIAIRTSDGTRAQVRIVGVRRTDESKPQ